MFGSKDEMSALEKLQPHVLPVNTLGESHELYQVRKSFYYVYVVNWLYNFKAYLKLSSEYLDVELFEMELLNLLTPPPLDESVLFINKLKSQLINQLTNSNNKFSFRDFDEVVKRFFEDTPAGPFDTLSLAEKFELLFVILVYLSSLLGFRAFLDKNPELQDVLNFNILKSTSKNNKREDYFLLFNDSKLYKRTTAYPEMVVPKKRKEEPKDPEDFYWDKFDIELTDMEFEIEAWTLDQFEEFVKTIKKNSPFKSLLSKDFQSKILAAELKKRRAIQNKKKEHQLINLMATRKKSSRLEQKDLQRKQELEEEALKKEEAIKQALETRKITQPLKLDSNVLSREERLKLRKLNNSYRKDVSAPTEAPGSTSEDPITLDPGTSDDPITLDSDDEKPALVEPANGSSGHPEHEEAPSEHVNGNGHHNSPFKNGDVITILYLKEL